MQDYRSLAADLVAALKKQGADACDVYINASSRFNTRVRLGKVEKLEQSISKGLGLRIFKNGATASTFTTDFTDRAVKDLAREALEIVKVSNADKHNGLAPKELLGVYAGKLLLFDEALAKIPTEKKIELAREMEEAGMKFDKRITNSNSANWTDSKSQVTLANSDGFVGQYQGTMANMSLQLIAEQDGVKQQDGWYSFSRFANQLDAPNQIGEEAARRTVKRLGGRKIKSQVVPVVLDPQVASELVALVFGAASGASIYRRASFLVDKLEQEIAAPLITIIDDGTLAAAPASRPFDAEGVKTAPVTVVEQGKLKSYVCDAYSSRRLKLKPTGSTARSYQSSPAVSASNLFMQPGAHTPQQIIKSVKSGIYLTELNGFGINSVTGDLSRGAVGYWIENGEITYPVQEITFASNVLKLLKGITMVGNDLSFKLGNIAAPTLLVAEATIGGA